MSKEQGFTRRDFLKTSALIAASVLAASCAQPEESDVDPTAVSDPTQVTEQAESTPVPEGEYSEAPMLAERVSAGELPPVDERLPEDVMVVNAGEGTLNPALEEFEIGEYGGLMRYVTARTNVCAELWDACCEPLFRVPGKLRAASVAEIKPMVFKGFSLNEDNTEITFHMRKGLKWSDGEPCTTDDVQFWYEDVLLNEDITPIPGKIYKAGNLNQGEVMDLEVIDDYTFKVTMDPANVALVEYLSRYSGNWHYLMRPAHYMKQFHKAYADPDEFASMLEEAKVPEGDWGQFYLQKDEGILSWTIVKSSDPDYPTLYPWIFEKESAGVKTWVRNPYYYKVDPAGNQLPYMDNLRIEFVGNVETVTMKMIAGEVDLAREYASMVNYSLYKENESKGNFIAKIYPTFVAPLQMRFNFTYPDENWRTLVRDVRFRKALNMAIDHEQIVDTVYKGYGKPPEILGVEYDPDGARALLDEMGLDERDSEGWRLGFDGERLIFPLEVAQGYSPEQDSVCTLMVEFWQDVGIKTDYRQIESTLYDTRRTNNDLYVVMGWAHTGFWRSSPTSSDFLPDASQLWNVWHDTNGAEGEEPEPWAKRLYEIADLADSYRMSEERVTELHNEMFEILKEQVPTVMPVDETVQLLLMADNLSNVPPEGYVTLSSMVQEQWYYQS